MAAGCCKEADTLPNTGLAAPANWQSTKRQEERMSEKQRVAIVTGAAGGIGRELVLGLLGKELKVAAIDRTAQGLAELAQAVQQRQQGGNLMTIEADLTRDESIDEIVSKARGHFGMIDILVNNAGVGQATVRSDNRHIRSGSGKCRRSNGSSSSPFTPARRWLCRKPIRPDRTRDPCWVSDHR